MNMGTPLIRTGKLVKNFGNVKALDDISLEIPEKEIFGLIGPDGAGKTTMLRILAGLMTPTSGNVVIMGHSVPDDAEALRPFLGYMSQRFSLYPDLTVEENLRFFSEITGVQGTLLDQRLESLYRMTRLSDFRKRLSGKLSGGMKQKLALMCTLLPMPQLLLLDEPTNGVDPISRREFWEILQQLQGEGISIIISTPYMDEAEWCTQIGLLYEGKFLAHDTPQNLKNQIDNIILEGETALLNPSQIEQVIQDPDVIDFHTFGGKIRITLRAGKKNASPPGRNPLLKKFKSARASIEDVFLGLLRETK